MRVLLFDEDPDGSVLLRKTLQQGGDEVIAPDRTDDSLSRQVRRLDPDIVIVDTPRPDSSLLDQLAAVMRECPRPIVLFTRSDDDRIMREALKAGVSSYVVNGLAPDRVRPIVDVARLRFEQWRTLQDDLDQTRKTLADRRLIDRAKGIVMKQRRCGEDEAYRLLRKTAMDQNKRIADVAEQVITFARLLA